MKKMQYHILFFIVAVVFHLITGPTSAEGAVKIGVVMVDHSGPEIYPARPDGKQCVACDEGQEYNDGFDHSADGYFSIKYFLAHLVNNSAHIPGQVADSFGPDLAHHQGIILMDKLNPSEIVDDDDYFDDTPYTPTLMDAWGEEGIYVDPDFPGAEEDGYISYTDLYIIYNDSDGTSLYIWPQPYPYPEEDPVYPAEKEALNTGEVPFYLLPRDVMNRHEDTTFDGGLSKSFGYGPWSMPESESYLEGPVVESSTASNYPDNGWAGMLGWEYDITPGTDWFKDGITVLNDVNAWEEHDFWEFVGFDTYDSWGKKGGREVYMEEVTGQMKQVRDWLWTNYETTLTGGATGEDKDDYIRVTYMIDPCFCNGVDPKNSIHGKSLWDAVYDLIVNIGVDKIVIHDHFIQLSQMMNDDMGWHMIMEAINAANETTGGNFSMMTDMVFAPGHPMMNMVSPTLFDDIMPSMNPFKDYYKKYHIGTKDVRELVKCEGWLGASPIWSDELDPPDDYLITKDMWVGGIAQRAEYASAIAEKALKEINWAVGDGADDIAVFMSNHGTPTKESWCFDSANEYLHFNNKLSFIRGVEAVLGDSTFTSTYGSITSKSYGPYPLTDAEVTDLEDQSDGDDISILDRDIQLCKLEMSSGRKIAFYRVSGQSAYDDKDPTFLVYSPREAINDIMAVQNPTADWNITHIIDFLYNFMGQSGDLLSDQRYDGYGESLDGCPEGETPDPQACEEQKYLSDLALVYSNPLIDDESNQNLWQNYQDSPEQYCYPTSGNPLNSSDPCWDFGHDDPGCTALMPEGCYVSLFTIYDDASDPRFDPDNTPNGIKVKITNGSWGWNDKRDASKNIIAEVLDGGYFDDDDSDQACPLAGSGVFDKEILSVLRSFRDSVLGKNKNTERYIDLYYKYGAEVNRILSRNDILRDDVRKCIIALLPDIRKMLNKDSVALSDPQKVLIKNCFKKLSKTASPGLRKDIGAFVDELEKLSSL